MAHKSKGIILQESKLEIRQSHYYLFLQVYEIFPIKCEILVQTN